MTPLASPTATASAAGPSRLLKSLAGHPAPLVIATLVSVALCLGLRMPCLGTGGSGAVATGTGCFNDLDGFWYGRGLDHHLLPYVNLLPGTPGTIEYPVLTGLLMWLAALPASSFMGFVASTTLIMATCAVAISLILQRLVGSLAWFWALSPTIVQSLIYNYDAPPALCAVAAAALVWGRDPSGVSSRRVVAAAALLAVGGSLKIYPLLFLAPLVLWLLTGAGAPARRWGMAFRAILVAVGTTLAVNVPFAIANPEGWLAPFTFQAVRSVDGSTLSLWAYLGHGVFIPSLSLANSTLMALATVSTAVGLLAVVVWSLRLWRRSNWYPVVGTMVALLGTYLALNKVFSLQHLLWLLPMVLLLRPPKHAVVALLAVDFALYWTYALYWFGVAVSEPVVAKFWWRLMLVALLARLGVVVYVVLLSLRWDRESHRAGQRPDA